MVVVFCVVNGIIIMQEITMNCFDFGLFDTYANATGYALTIH